MDCLSRRKETHDDEEEGDQQTEREAGEEDELEVIGRVDNFLRLSPHKTILCLYEAKSTPRITSRSFIDWSKEVI